jgi:hypothetical protein
MVWGKRTFEHAGCAPYVDQHAGYAPYMDHLERLLSANPTRYREFIMVSIQTSNPGIKDYYVGVPHKAFMSAFDDFEQVEESNLPKIIDTLHIADATTDEFTSRFRFRHNT